MPIEKVSFELGQLVYLIVAPELKCQIVSKTLYADGGCQYKIIWYDKETGNIKEGYFFPCELGIIEDI